MPYLFGTDTKTIILKQESHKLFQEFEVEAAVSIKKGMPVYITGDGQVSPAIVSNTTQQFIGISMHDGDAGELVTVMMKAWAIIFAECETDSLAPGPVRIGSTNPYNGTTGYVLIDDASVSATNQLGWALEGGDDGDIVRVALL